MHKRLCILPGFRAYITDRSRTTYLIFLVIAISGAIILYFIKGNSTQISLAEQMLHREQIITRSGALSIGDFLTDLGRTLSVYASREEIIEENSVLTQHNMNMLIDTWHGTPVAAMILTDKKGNVVVDLNNAQNQDLGADLSDRAFFQWATKAVSGSYYIGNPVVSRLGATKGQYIIPVAVPVFDRNGNFNGILTAIVSLRGLAEKYVNPLKISDNTDIYMLDNNANLVFSTVPKYLGKNLTEVTDVVDFPGKEEVVQILKSEFAKPTTEGKLDVNLPDIDEGGKVVRSLLAYSTVDIGINTSSDWYLVISTPAADAFMFTGIFYADQLTSLIYFIVVVLAFSIIEITSGGYKRLN